MDLVFWLCLPLSLGLWGILRTALWLLPGLINQDFMVISAASLLSFFCLVPLLVPYQKKAFDLRNLPKDRWALIFFLTAVLASVLLYPVSFYFYPLAALIPWFWIQFFKVVRIPLSELYCWARWWRWIPLGLWAVAALWHWRNLL
jgi:hypothetical protein